jgi:oligosaccharyltransferase complex subunit gamma
VSVFLFRYKLYLTASITRGFSAQPLAEHLSHHTPIPIPYSAPIDWGRLVVLSSGLLAFALALYFVAPLLMNRWMWTAIIVLTSLIMTSGYMFTRIRGVPYTGAHGQWIAENYQNQFGQEVHVVASLCKLFLL